MIGYLSDWTVVIDGWRPDARLSINGRRRTNHWTVRKLQAEAKEWTQWALRGAATENGGQLPKFSGLVEVKVTFCYTTHRRRDPDGLAGMVKPCLDAMVAEGILQDDDTEHVRLLVTARCPVPMQPRSA